jgi:hypothetical protein
MVDMLLLSARGVNYIIEAHPNGTKELSVLRLE